MIMVMALFCDPDQLRDTFLVDLHKLTEAPVCAKSLSALYVTGFLCIMLYVLFFMLYPIFCCCVYYE